MSPGYLHIPTVTRIIQVVKDLCGSGSGPAQPGSSCFIQVREQRLKSDGNSNTDNPNQVVQIII